MHPMTSPALGIIEGFYGPAWTWQQRQQLVRLLAPGGYGHYLYAPKSDSALRRAWADPFAETWLHEIDQFRQFCRVQNMEFGIGFSPYGLHQQFDLVAQQKLRSCLAQLVPLKLDRLAILFDDMPVAPDMAQVQARIVSSICASGVAGHYTVCPSFYSDDVILEKVFGARPAAYLETLCAQLDEAIDVFWTGEEVCSRQFSVNHLQRVAQQMGRKPTLWDNYPVNDGPRMSTHLHLRAMTGRPAAIASLIRAHYINPALQPTLTAIPALTLADSYQSLERYNYSEAFDRAATQVCGSQLAQALKQDVLLLQDAGRGKLTADQVNLLQNRYAAFDHPAAVEVVQFLNGHYDVSLEQVQTQ
jgi:hyaluronoglucosaminidase